MRPVIPSETQSAAAAAPSGHAVPACPLFLPLRMRGQRRSTDQACGPSGLSPTRVLASRPAFGLSVRSLARQLVRGSRRFVSYRRFARGLSVPSVRRCSLPGARTPAFAPW